jgi:hypothetical protein
MQKWLQHQRKAPLRQNFFAISKPLEMYKMQLPTRLITAGNQTETPFTRHVVETEPEWTISSHGRDPIEIQKRSWCVSAYSQLRLTWIEKWSKIFLLHLYASKWDSENQSWPI